jgi:hypothetical protein
MTALPLFLLELVLYIIWLNGLAKRICRSAISIGSTIICDMKGTNQLRISELFGCLRISSMMMMIKRKRNGLVLLLRNNSICKVYDEKGNSNETCSGT